MKAAKTLMMPALLLSMLLAGCGETSGSNPGGKSQSGDSGASTSESSSEGKTKVLFWHTLGDVKATYVDNMAKRFMTAHPDVEITATQITGNYDDLEEIIKTNITTGNLPTMAFCYPDNVAEYMSEPDIDGALVGGASLEPDSFKGLIEGMLK